MAQRIASTLLLVFAPLAIAACHQSEDLGRLPDGGAGAGGRTDGAGTGAAGTTGTGGSAGTAGAGGVAGSGGATTGVAGAGGTTSGGAGASGTAGIAGAGGTKATAGAGGASASGGNAGASAGAGGQTEDCTGFPIPADHPIAATEYEPTADTVRDLGTGLMWQRKVDAANPVNLIGMSRCPGNGLGGFDDWRLPTALELASIVDFGVENPTLSASAFPGAPAGYYGTSSPIYMHSGSFWSIDFKTGLTLNGSPTGYIRCVRRDFPTICFSGPRFRFDTKGSASTGVNAVADASTGATWAEDASPELTWDQAKQYCGSLNRNGRLPTAKELLSLVDWNTAAAIDLTFFPDTLRANYWTSTPVPGSTTSVLTVAFGAATYSGTYATPMTEGHPVRCIVSP